MIPVHTDAARIFLSVWQRLVETSGAGVLPRKTDLDPSELVPALPHFWLYRRLPDRTILCHFTGEDVTQAWNAPTRGRPMSDIIRNGQHNVVEARFNQAIDRKMLVHGYNETPGSDHIYAERIYAPFQGDKPDEHYVAGVSVYRNDDPALLDHVHQSLQMKALIAYDAFTFDRIGRFDGPTLVDM